MTLAVRPAASYPSRSVIAAVPPEWQGELIDLGGEDRDPESIFRPIVAEVEDEASLVAIGNIHGQGERLLEHLEELGQVR